MSKLATRLLPAALLEALAGGPDIWLVGGALRDHFLQRDRPDRDFAVDGGAVETARRIADRLGADYFTLDRERDAGRVLWGGHGTLDFVRLRGSSIEADLHERDYTINAMAAPLGGGDELIDPLGGLQDLRDRVLKACRATALTDDPIRTLRGVRLAHDLRLKLPPVTATQIREAAARLSAASPERVRDELVRMLRPASAGALRLAHELGCLGPVLPEAVADPVAAQAALEIVSRLVELLAGFDAEARGENIAAAQVGLALGRYRSQLEAYLEQVLPGGRQAVQIVFLAALHWPLEDDAAAVSRRARALHFSRREAQWARAIVAHADPGRALAIDTPLQRFHYLETAGGAAVGSVLLSLAISLTERVGHAEWERRTLTARGLIELALGETAAAPPLLDGNQLMSALDLRPGPQVGWLLRKLREAQIEGRIDDAAQAVALARSLRGGESAAGDPLG